MLQMRYCHQMSHFKAKMHHIRFLASVRLCLRWSLALGLTTFANFALTSRRRS